MLANKLFSLFRKHIMTTYTLTGLHLTVGDLNGDGQSQIRTDTKASVLKIVTPDDIESFSYNYIGSGPNVSFNTNFYGATLNGKNLDLSEFGTSWATTAERLTTSFITTDYFSLNLQSEASNTGYSFHVFTMRGSQFPTFHSDADTQAFALTFPTFSAIVDGEMAPGEDVNFLRTPNVVMTEKDKIKGTSGDDEYFGGYSNDVIKGMAGRDELHGGKGNDILNGGGGRDILHGNQGKDLFQFRKGSGKDIITDFKDDVDTIELHSKLWDGDLGKKRILKKFADVVDGDIVLDFGKHELKIEGFTDLSALANDLIIV